MTGRSSAKDLHRLMRRIGPLTDDQASIDDVNWEDGRLSTFGVTIRPNASFYKGGRFEFTVTIPEDFTDGGIPKVWCDTPIHHPNIDTGRNKTPGTTNICLNLFDSDVWSSSHGLEGIVLGVLFLLHNPNVNDPLIGGLPSDLSGLEDEVKRYMATGEIDEKMYDIDFRVVDGEFKDLRETEDVNSNTAVEVKANEQSVIDLPDLAEDDIDAEDIRPVRFIRADVDYDMDNASDVEDEFYLTFDDVDTECNGENTNTNEDNEEAEQTPEIRVSVNSTEDGQNEEDSVERGDTETSKNGTEHEGATNDECGGKDTQTINEIINTANIETNDKESFNGIETVSTLPDITLTHGSPTNGIDAESDDRNVPCLDITINPQCVTADIASTRTPDTNEKGNPDKSDKQSNEKYFNRTGSLHAADIQRNRLSVTKRFVLFGIMANLAVFVFKKIRNR